MRATLRRPARWPGPLLLLLPLLLVAPSLGGGFGWDDFLLRDGARGPLSTVSHNLFVWMDGEPAHTRAAMASGAFPWWALPDARLAFWRPLAALTHWIDFRLWPDAPALMHLQNLAWYGALLAAILALYRRLLEGGGAAALATLLYGLDDARGLAVGWIANRNGLMAALGGVLALLWYDRWRREGWRPGGWLAPLALGLALLSAEAATATLAYLVAHACCLDRAPWRARLGALAPSGTLLAGWLALYRSQGFGAWGTAYLDPAREPAAFLWEAAWRAPVLLLGQWAYPPAELFHWVPESLAGLWLSAAIAFAALLAWGFWPLLRHAARARFWALGMLLALLPAVTALPASRLLLFVGLGGAGLMALLLGAWPTLSRGRRGLAAALALLHLGVAPLLLPVMALSPALLGGGGAAALALPAGDELWDQVLVVVSAPSFFDVGNLRTIRAAAGLSVPESVRFLGAGPGALRLTRLDERRLLIEPEGGYLQGFDPVFRGRHHPLAQGEEVALPGVTVRVEALTPDGRPAAVTFAFDHPLEHPSLRWVRWERGALLPIELPRPGEALRLPPPLP